MHLRRGATHKLYVAAAGNDGKMTATAIPPNSPENEKGPVSRLSHKPPDVSRHHVRGAPEH